MSKVAFVNPPYLPGFSRESRSPCVTISSTMYYPYTLALGTGISEREGFRALLIDAVNKNYGKEAIRAVEKFGPSVVVVDTSTPSIYSDIEFAERIKENLPKATVVLVGRHVSWVPEETLRLCKNVEVVARGEFYSAIIDLLEEKNYEEIKGISYKESDEIRNNPPAELMDPDEIPFVSEVYKKHLDIHDYFYSSLTNPYILLYYGFGCPFKCDFCNEWIKGRYRHRSIESMVEELKFIKKELPQVREILFDDPTFVIREDDTVELCNEMMDNRLKMRWSINTRCNVSFEILKIMREAGCRLAHVGIESASQEVLNAISKGINLDRITQYLFDSKKAGILNHGCFIVGLPNDTKQTIRNTIEYVKKVPLDTIQVFPFIPYPGTAAYQWAKQNGYLITEDYSRWLKPDGSYNCVVSRPDLTADEVLEWCRMFIREFYFRPSYVGYKLRQSFLCWHEMKRNLRAFRSMMKRSQVASLWNRCPRENKSKMNVCEK